MRTNNFLRSGLLAFFLSAIGLSLFTATATPVNAETGRLQTIYSFDRRHFGPTDLVYVNGSLYGFTQQIKGLYATFFKLSLDGTVFTPLFEFEHDPHDRVYIRGVVVLNDNIYGTVSSGGAFGLGYLFKMSVSGQRTILHSFSGHDGAYPGELTAVDGVIYGSSGYVGQGGKGPTGTIFKINPDGSGFGTVYFFPNTEPERMYPSGPLTNIDGLLYITVMPGGENGGAVYRITTRGRAQLVHEFSNVAYLICGVTPLNGLIYGVSIPANLSIPGSLYSMGFSGGGFKTVHNFRGAPRDGADPTYILRGAEKLYGLTGFGGAFDHGTIFSIDANSTVSILSSFPGYPRGAYPFKLIMVDGVFYGITLSGGTKTGSPGNGTVFKYTP